MERKELEIIIKPFADQYEIDKDLILSFCFVESSCNQNATRYESNFYKTYIQPLLIKQSITPKEAIGRATSWGLMQIMGQVAREKGFKGQFEELCTPSVGLFWSLKHLKHFIEKYPDCLNDAISSYNAGHPNKRDDGRYRNQAYVDRVHFYLDKIKETV